MRLEHFNNIIEKYKNAGNTIYGFYVTYKETDNITSQKWGKIYEFGKIVEEIQNSKNCIQGELPIERLIIFSNDIYSSQCLVFVKNPLWDCVNDESEYSHVHVVVPYIAEDGWFGHIETDKKQKN